MPSSPFFPRMLRYLVIIISLGFVCLEVSAQTIKYKYDALGRVRVVEDGVNGNRGYDYDAAGNRINVAGPDFVPPTTPSALAVTNITINSAKVSWTASTDNVGVSGYEYTLNGGTWNPLGSSPSVNLLGLSPSTNYAFVLRAKDAGGNNSAIANTSFRTLDDARPPGIPVIGQITSSSATATWTASATVGATYEWSINGGASWTATSSTSASVSGLIPGTAYTFTVRAIYGTARSTLSSASFTALAVASPGTPTFSSITSAIVTASWTPSSTPGASYEWSTDGNNWITTTSLTATAYGLTPGRDYTFAVRAIYSGVRSTQSSSVFRTADVGSPGTPSFSNITYSSATASWSASATTGATYEWSINGGTSWNPTPYTYASPGGLTSNSSYIFQVRAVFSTIRSITPSASFTTLPFVVGVPGSPSITAITTTTATASWGASSTAGATYEYQLYAGGTWYSTSTTTVSLTNLTPGGGYNFTVRALAAGVYSNPVSQTFAVPYPDTSPTGVPSVSSGGLSATSVTMQWGPSGSQDATYEWTVDGWATVFASPAGPRIDNRCTVTGLQPSRSYRFEVRAIANGKRSVSSYVDFTTPAAPAPLAMVGSLGVGVPTATSVPISWLAATGNPGPDTYEYTINGGTSWVTAGNTLSTTVSGLNPYTSYSISVRARNAGGASTGIGGSFSTLSTPLSLAGPLNIGFTTTTTSISISWTTASGSPGADSYEYALASSGPWTSVGNTLASTATGLTPNTSYTIYVRAKNSLGTSNPISNTWSTQPVTLAMPSNAKCWENWARGAWKGQWDAVPGAHHYVFKAQNKPETTVYDTNTGNTPIEQSTKPCSWVQACDATGLCGPKQYTFN